MSIRRLVVLLVGAAFLLSPWAASADDGEKKPPTAPPPSASPSSKEMRQAVERSLVFLEKSANDWYAEGKLHSVELKDGRKIVGGTVQKKCVSCHHLPMTIWALTEAKEHGFSVDDKSLSRLRDQALAPHLRTPDLKPVVGNQDSRGDSKTVMNTIYLSTAVAAASKPDEQATGAMKKFAVHLLDMQEADGRWRASRTEYQPPVIDIDEVLTMQALLVLATAHERGYVDADKWATSRSRALAWLRKTQLQDQHQSLALNVLVSQRFGKPEEVKTLLEQLLQAQNADGGWSQVAKLPSDALATGQTLYVLAVAGSGNANEQRALQRAQAFLMDTQLKDGSWWVPTRNAQSKNRKGQASSHYGSGWATIGLIRTLDKPEQAKGRAREQSGSVASERTAPMRLEFEKRLLGGSKFGPLFPTFADFDGDGVVDLLVGVRIGGGAEGRLLVYRNRGTNAAPVYAKPYWFDDVLPSGRIPPG